MNKLFIAVHIHFEKDGGDDQIGILLVTKILKAISELKNLVHENKYFSSTSALFILIPNAWWLEDLWGGVRFPE